MAAIQTASAPAERRTRDFTGPVLAGAAATRAVIVFAALSQGWYRSRDIRPCRHVFQADMSPG